MKVQTRKITLEVETNNDSRMMDQEHLKGIIELNIYQNLGKVCNHSVYHNEDEFEVNLSSLPKEIYAKGKEFFDLVDNHIQKSKTNNDSQ